MNNTLKKNLKKEFKKKISRKKKGGEVPPSLTGSVVATDDDIDDIIYKTNKREMTFKNRLIRFIKKILEKIKNFGRYNGGKRKTVKRKNKQQKKTLRYKKNKN